MLYRKRCSILFFLPLHPVDKMKAAFWRPHYGPLTASLRPFGSVAGLLTHVKNWRHILPPNSSKMSAKAPFCFLYDATALQAVARGDSNSHEGR